MNKQPAFIISIAAMIAALTMAIPLVQARCKVERIPFFDILFMQRGTTHEISGIVVDSVRGVLPNALLTLKGLGISTIADEGGMFELAFPHKYKGQTVMLAIIAPGYQPEEFSVLLEDLDEGGYYLEMNKDVYE